MRGSAGLRSCSSAPCYQAEAYALVDRFVIPEWLAASDLGDRLSPKNQTQWLEVTAYDGLEDMTASG